MFFLWSVLIGGYSLLYILGNKDYVPLLNFERELCDPRGSSCIVNVSINITEDRILEDNETFEIEMRSGIPQVTIQNAITTATILDDDSE